ncbi:MAG TPA: toxin-antitoxin system HicB family antitoxin [Pyrinomonadaceae bacterium]|nr:toxin-antitoxin system HicB family antitoxin [Pyrinomonadaceae bacterium]
MVAVKFKTTNKLRTPRAEDYAYSVVWSEEDAAFIGRVAEFGSLAAHGSTQEKALKEIRKVVELVIAEMSESGEKIPEPISKRSFSGKLNLRMPQQLHRRLSLEAEREGISLNQWINAKLAGSP